MKRPAGLDAEIEALLANADYVGHPLHEALSSLYRQLQDQVRQLDRITRISDGFQSAARREAGSLTERLNKQVRQLEKIARISDGYQTMLQDLNKRLEHESTHDPLTGLANRRLALSRLLQWTAGSGALLCVALVDVDHFKQINDLQGHETGDRALVTIAERLRDPAGGAHLVARWGGEEFLLIWTGIDLAQAEQQAQCLRESVQAELPGGNGESFRCTASFGLACWQPGEAIDALLRRADAAVYAAKHAGRNQVRVAP
jgi:diguanylate cyclase (GGDEF)-like protein